MKKQVLSICCIVAFLLIGCGELENSEPPYIPEQPIITEPTQTAEPPLSIDGALEYLREIDGGLYWVESCGLYAARNWGVAFPYANGKTEKEHLAVFMETQGHYFNSGNYSYSGGSPLSDSLLGIKYMVDDGTYPLKLNTDYKIIAENGYKIYQNPDALSIGYMVSSDIQKIVSLGNDNTFNSQNVFMSTVTGNTVFGGSIEEGGITIDSFREYYTRIPETVNLRECYEECYGDQIIYKPNVDRFNQNAGTLKPCINVRITAKNSDMIYMYLKTLNESQVKISISTEKNAYGEFINHQPLGGGFYFENGDYHSLRVGEFPAGTEIEVRLGFVPKAKTGEQYTIIKEFFFYQFDYAMFKSDFEKLKENQWHITDFNDRYIEGTITAKDGQVMFTSIPFSESHAVYVDGVKVKAFSREISRYSYDGDESFLTKYLCGLLATFIGIELEPGEHTVRIEFK